MHGLKTCFTRFTGFFIHIFQSTLFIANSIVLISNDVVIIPAHVSIQVTNFRAWEYCFYVCDFI